jgi:dTDP-glucose 4,6-dehydratase
MTRAITRFLRYGSDLAVWLWTILFRGETCHPYNVGSAQEITISDLARSVASLLGDSVQPSTSKFNAPASHYVPSVDRALSEFKLMPWTAMNEAIQKTAAWW